jgi:hypothetical protein
MRNLKRTIRAIANTPEIALFAIARAVGIEAAFRAPRVLGEDDETATLQSA